MSKPIPTVDDALALIASATEAYNAGEWDKAIAAATIAAAAMAARGAWLADLTDTEVAEQALAAPERVTLRSQGEVFAERRLNGPMAPDEPVFSSPGTSGR